MSSQETASATGATGPSQSTSARSAGRSRIAIALACLILATIIRTEMRIDEQGEQYRVKDTESIVGGQWLSGMLLGFREAVADLMWIRVDEYFHEGRYDKIMPICYVITAMDPGWIDVYTTGAWHLGYNFGDRRLVPAAIEFDRRGVMNNPLNYDMAYELGWMQMSRGYQFAEAAKNFKRANELELRPVGKTHAYPHAVEDAGNVDEAIAIWKSMVRPDDSVPARQVAVLSMRKDARKDLGQRPIEVHLYVKLVKTGPRVLELQGVTNLPKYSRVYFDLDDANSAGYQRRSEVWRMAHETLYSQKETTLQPEMGIFNGEEINFYQETLRVHQDDKQYQQYPTEPELPVKNGHMIIENGSFKTTIDMATNADQYPLESQTYTLTLFVDPRREPITTQDVIGWNGEGMSGPLVKKVNGYNQLWWNLTLKKRDIE